MSAAVVDTSVTIAWYLPQTFSTSARRWHSRFLDGKATFFVPSLHYWEFGNVLRTYVRRKELDGDSAREIWTLHLDADLEIAEPERNHVLDVAFEYDATVYDAVYISLALNLDASLLTAERPSTPWVKKLGKRAITL